MGRPKLEVPKAVQKKIVGAYTRKRSPAGLVALSDDHNISIPVVRRILVENGVTIRGRGRPVTRKKKAAAKK